MDPSLSSTDSAGRTILINRPVSLQASMPIPSGRVKPQGMLLLACQLDMHLYMWAWLADVQAGTCE